MVEPEIAAIHVVYRRAEFARDPQEQLCGRIANAGHAWTRFRHQRLRDQSRRIGKVDDPGVRGRSSNRSRLFDCHGKCTESHGETRRACGFLPGEAAFERQPFVPGPRFDASHANTADSERTTVDCLRQSRGRADPDRRALREISAKRCHQLRVLVIDIVKRNFRDLQFRVDDTVQQDRCPQTAPDHRNFHSFAPNCDCTSCNSSSVGKPAMPPNARVERAPQIFAISRQVRGFSPLSQA